MVTIHDQTETLNIKIYDQMNQRQILFRGLTASNEWVEGCLIYDFESGYTSQFIEDVPPRTWQIFDFNGHRHEVIESSIGQFTGLYDKNGKRIFEGDVVAHNKNLFFVRHSKNQHVLLLRDCNHKTNWRSLEWLSRVLNYTTITTNIHDTPNLVQS